MELSLEVRHDAHGAATVTVGGEIDPCTGERLIEYAMNVMRQHGPWLAVDLAGVTFMDCGGLSGLLAIRTFACLLGGQLSVVSTSAPVRRILHILELDALFAVGSA
jgi:anti-sigma B factor antagonist